MFDANSIETRILLLYAEEAAVTVGLIGVHHMINQFVLISLFRYSFRTKVKVEGSVETVGMALPAAYLMPRTDALPLLVEHHSDTCAAL